MYIKISDTRTDFRRAAKKQALLYGQMLVEVLSES